MPASRRVLVRRGLSQHPLRRPIDRLEGYLTVLLAALLLIGCTATGWITGPLIYRLTGPQHHAGVSSVMATVISMPVERPAALYSPTATARALWTDRAGAAHEGQFTAPRGTVAGQTLPIWVDSSGQLAATPPSTSDRITSAVAISVMAISFFAALMMVIAAGIQWALDRSRLAQWEREWRTTEPLWCRD
jgi:hypothetical protein